LGSLAAGTMSDATTYQIDYNFKPAASYTEPGASDPKTIVRSFPSLQSEQTAEQLAFTLVDTASTPVYAATVEIPQAAGWSVIDEIDPDRVPTAGETLQLRELETTPAGVVAQLESRERVGEIVDRLRQRLGRTEERA